MQEKFEYKIDIEGYPCQRPRFGKYGNAHNTNKYKKYKNDLVWLIKNCKIPKKDYQYVAIKFYFSYPQSTPLKKRIDEEPMRNKYDIDNLVKTFLDCLQDAEIIVNDRRICGIYAEKMYTTENKGWTEFDLEE